MAIPVSENPEISLREFVLAWFEALGRGDVESALSMIDLPTSYGFRWTEESLGQAISEYGAFSLSSITPPSSLAVGPPHTSFGQFDDGTGYWLDCDIPIDGEWSDLTAQFEFVRKGDGLSIALQDVHVL